MRAGDDQAFVPEWAQTIQPPPQPKRGPIRVHLPIPEEPKPAPQPPEQVWPRSRAAYILFGLFFGGLGIHNFYAGRDRQATLQLILGVTAIFLVGYGMMSWSDYLAEDYGNDVPTALIASGILLWIISHLWAFFEAIANDRDGRGILMR